jgi:WD40 repeat protein
LKPVAVHLPQSGNFTVYDFAPAADLALAGNEKGEVLLLPLKGGGAGRKASIAEIKSVNRARLSPDGKVAVVLGESGKNADDTVAYATVMLDTADGKILQSFQAQEKNDHLTGMAFSPDGATFAIGHRNGTAEIRDRKSLRQLKILPAARPDETDTRTLAFSPDGRFLIGGGLFDDTVFIWNVATGKVVRSYAMGPLICGYRYASALALSRDGKTLAAGLGQRAVSSGDLGAERGNVVVWNARSGKRLFTLRSQRGAIFALTFSADDRWIISGSLDGTISYWDRRNGKLMATATGRGDGTWLVLTEAGFYAGSDDSGAAIAVVHGDNAVPASLIREHLLRPDLVEQLLKGDASGRYRNAVRALNLRAMLKSATRESR